MMRSIAPTALVMLLTALLLHRPLGQGWWRWDDPTHLLSVHEFSIFELLFSPTAWQTVSTVNFTPLLSLSFALDVALTGLDPALAYARQVLTIAVIGVLFAALVRPHFEGNIPPSVAWLLSVLAAIVLLLGAPMVYLGQQLMARHYLEGLLFALGAIHALRQAGIAARRDRRRQANYWIGAGALAFALAAMSKEVFLPLALIAPWLAAGVGPSTRWRIAALFGAIVALYMVWRTWMLSGEVGGYAAEPQLATLAAAALEFALWLPLGLVGSPALLLTLIALIGIALAVTRFTHPKLEGSWLRRHRARLLWSVVIAGLSIGPLLPLLVWPGIHTADRYLTVPWVVGVFALWVFILAPLSQRWAGRCAPADHRDPRIADPGPAHPGPNPAGLADPLYRHRSGIAVLAALVVCGLFVPQYLSTRAEVQHQVIEQEQQLKFFFTADTSTIFWPSDKVALAFWDHLRPLSYLRDRTIQAPAAEHPGDLFGLPIRAAHPSPVGPRLILDEIDLARLTANCPTSPRSAPTSADAPADQIHPDDCPILKAVWHYDADCGCMRHDAPGLAARINDWRLRLAEFAEITVSACHAGRSIRWRFGPSDEARYVVVGANVGRLPLPAAGQLHIPGGFELGEFYVRYEAPDGQLHYSDTMTLGDC